MKKLLFFVKFIIIASLPVVFNFLFVSDVNSYTRVQMDEAYADGYIDALFVGASLTYRSIDTKKIEDKLKLNAFNFGTSAQQVQGAYYIIKELNKNGIGTVYLDMSYHNKDIEKPQKTQTYIVADYLKDKKNKCEYLLDSFGIDGIVNGVFPFLHGYEVSFSNALKHISGDYKLNDYSYVTYDNEEYKGQGFVYSYESVPEDFVFELKDGWNSHNPISDFSIEYIEKIIMLCNDNNINLVFLIPPEPSDTLYSIGNYPDYMERVSAIAQKNDIIVYDFNLAKKELLSLERIDFKDEVHLNGIGAEKFTDALIKVLSCEHDSYFYNDIYEKWSDN